jgi:pyrroline-5-carboxylate reductase
MSDSARISFIGGGVMASAFVSSLLGKRIVSEDDVMVSSRSWATLEVMRERQHVHTTLSNREAAQFGDVVLLAVKPQNLERVFADIKGVMRPEQVLMSIVAGAGIDRLTAGTDHDRIVRCIPNTPAQIGAGMSVWAASPQVTQEDRARVRSVLGAVGIEIEVDDERYVDMATAVSGTGPAYVFLFIEAFIDAAVHLGFQRDMALELVLQTMEGSLRLARSSPKYVADLKNSVTSPGETTTEALDELEKGGFRTALSKAVGAVYQRTLTLKG